MISATQRPDVSIRKTRGASNEREPGDTVIPIGIGFGLFLGTGKSARGGFRMIQGHDLLQTWRT